MKVDRERAGVVARGRLGGRRTRERSSQGEQLVEVQPARGRRESPFVPGDARQGAARLETRAFRLCGQPPDVQLVAVERGLQVHYERPWTGDELDVPERQRADRDDRQPRSRRLAGLARSRRARDAEHCPHRQPAVRKDDLGAFYPLREQSSQARGDRNLADRGAGRLTDRDIVKVDHHAREERRAQRGDRHRFPDARRQLCLERPSHGVSADAPAGKQHDSDREHDEEQHQEREQLAKHGETVSDLGSRGSRVLGF